MSLHRAKCKAYPAEMVPHVWEQVVPFIQMALDKGSNYTLEEIHQGLLAREMVLLVWQDPEIRAALVLAVQIQDGIKFCLLLTVGGDSMKDWIILKPDLEAWAREQGCEEMRIYGRIGWAKVTGYDIEYAKMVGKL